MAKVFFGFTALLAFESVAITNAFTHRLPFKPISSLQKHGNDLKALPTSEESAQALTDYMAKAHEEKLNCLKELEQKKDAELQALKKELEELKKSRGSSSIELAASSAPPTPVVSGSKEELAAKLVAYQRFMSDYIVKAAEQKLKAVREAEIATSKKYEAQLLLLSGTAASDSATIEPPKILPTNVNEAFTKRNAKVTAAAAQGKSRWGDEEVERAKKFSEQVKQISSSTPETTTSAATVETTQTKVIDVEIPAEILEADHGLRADGGVGGLTLAERVLQGAQAQAPTSTVTITSQPSVVPVKDTSRFEKRNSFVLKAVEAGKNYRWGDMEVANVKKYEEQKKVLSSSAATTPVINVEEADHGLRADGGVGGPSLSDRVNLGAALLTS